VNAVPRLEFYHEDEADADAEEGHTQNHEFECYREIQEAPVSHHEYDHAKQEEGHTQDLDHEFECYREIQEAPVSHHEYYHAKPGSLSNSDIVDEWINNHKPPSVHAPPQTEHYYY